ncbi:unnamed protein product, partial [Laminaria digitata]
HFHVWPYSFCHRRSHRYNAETEHVGFSPTTAGIASPKRGSNPMSVAGWGYKHRVRDLMKCVRMTHATVEVHRILSEAPHTRSSLYKFIIHLVQKRASGGNRCCVGS